MEIETLAQRRLEHYWKAKVQPTKEYGQVL